ncbi:TPA: hypothetical protein HA361_03115 [Candidatus Woesearchaeota archaeon]|nr:hypothetical protein [Candidatus Woesearchaeota archaeon]HII68415.1 hypothetical protein [Candidatus Woesearchaeota archaeon]
MDTSSYGIPEQLSADATFRLVVRHLTLDHKYGWQHIERLLAEEKQVEEGKFAKAGSYMVPASVFSSGLSSLEAIIKYLAEAERLKNTEIAALLNRNIRTTWATYRNASRKHPLPFASDSRETVFIPATAIADRSFSTLESIVRYMKGSLHLELSEIAAILHRSPSTIWTVYARIKKKEGGS